jgi:anti-sigma factor RsiW
MSDHPSALMLTALIDGELTPDQLAQVNEHFASCSLCTSSALRQSLLKSAVGKAGERYVLPTALQQRLARLVKETEPADIPAPRNSFYSNNRLGILGWATAALLLIAGTGGLFVYHKNQSANIAAVQQASLVTEVFDQHVATLAGTMPPEVLSTDRHTVKPWFQGKIPFSFNLPEGLPQNTTLDGANLTYLHNRAAAQLLYSIGKHRVSVFVSERLPAPGERDASLEHAGFHVISFDTAALHIVAVSDVEMSRLTELVDAIRQVQTGEHK